MENTLLVALTRQSTLRRELDTVANNLANMNTNGYKSEKMMFVDHLVRSKGGEHLWGDKIAYVRDIAQYIDMQDGKLVETGNSLDVSIHKDGFFTVQTPAGPRYTRDGHFSLNEEGTMVTSQGYPVLSEDGTPFNFPVGNSRIEISRNGIVHAENGELGKLGIVRFNNIQDMKKEAGSLYDTAQAPEPMQNPHVIQGSLEGSNVEPILEMTRMIEIQRAYTSASKLIEKEDERISKVAQILSNN